MIAFAAASGMGPCDAAGVPCHAHLLHSDCHEQASEAHMSSATIMATRTITITGLPFLLMVVTGIMLVIVASEVRVDISSVQCE